MKATFEVGQDESGRRVSIETLHADTLVVLRHHLGPPANRDLCIQYLTKSEARAIASALMGAAAEL